MKRILLFIFLTIVLQLHAQEGFVKSYNFGYPTAVQFDAMLLDESELILCGFLNDSVPPHKQGVIFAKIDTSGNVISHKVHFDVSGYDLASGVARYSGGLIKILDNSGYLFTGGLLQDSGGFLIKLDLEGNLIWLKTLEDTISSQGRYLHLLETETGFLVAGVKQIPQDLMNDIFVIKADKEGNVLWEERHGEIGKSDIIRTFSMVNKNEYLLSGSKSIGNFGESQLQIFGVDSLGIEKWYWQTTESSPPNMVENGSCIGLHQTESGHWVHATIRAENQSSSNSWYLQTQFVVRDNNFNILSQHVYDDVDGQTNNFYNLIPLSDGDWLGIGSNRELVPSPSTVPSHNYAWMMRISSGEDGITNLGDSLWTRLDLTFPDSMFQQGQYLHSAVELPGGSVIAAGYSSASSYVDHGLLIKVNQHGCTDFSNCTPTNLLNADTVLYLSTCDPSEVGSLQYVYPDQNGEDSVVVETTTLIPPPAAPVPISDLVIEENAPPFTLTIPEVPDAVTYAWTVPTSVQILSGADSTSVSIQWDDLVTNGLVCVSAINECGSSPAACTEVSVDFTDDLSEVSQKSYSVFPNPVDEVLHIVFEEEGKCEIVLLDILGREVIPATTYFGQTKIEMRTVAVGSYWLRISNEQGRFWELVEVLR